MLWSLRAGSDLAKIIGIIAVGMPASLLFTAQVAVSIRKMVDTKLEDTPTPKKLPPFKRFHYNLWGSFLCIPSQNPLQDSAAGGLCPSLVVSCCKPM